jgi:DinB superfamily
MNTIEPIDIPDATTQPDAYVAALLRTLGARDPLEVCERTVAEVGRLCQDLDEQAWLTPMAPGEWNAQQVVGHLFDVDVVYGFRWRLALTEEVPSYPGYDEKAWSRLARPAPRRLLEAFAALRDANLALLRSLGEADLRRSAVHGEQGSEDVQRMIAKVAGHDLAHLNQLRRTVAAATRTQPAAQP